MPSEVTSGPGWHWDSRGWLVVDGSGALVTGLAVSGHVEIYASNVTVRGNDINQPGDDWGIGLRAGTNVTIDQNNIYSPAATGSSRLEVGIKDFGGAIGVKITRNNIWHVSTGVQIEQGLIQGNYIHDMGYNDGDHLNGITSNGGISALLAVRGNTILNSYSQTDCISLFQDFGNQVNRVLDDNLLAGGGYTIYGGEGSNGKPTNIEITNNRIASIYYPAGGYYGPVAYFDAGGSGNVWSGNVWDSTGATLRNE